VPDVKSRELRNLVRARASLKAQSTVIKNQIHAILRTNWITSPWTDTFGKSGRKFLEGLEIGESAAVRAHLSGGFGKRVSRNNEVVFPHDALTSVC
jgi:hypothetical protein